jgi:chemosensory pili system protein ChpA (sensor histidine kinase/response regulator)
MKTEDTVEYNSLRWVKKELDLILTEAQTSLSAYIEDNDEADRLRECIDHLHMVQGTLQMVELFGAAQLAEEMELVAVAVLNHKIEKTDDAYDVLMRSMLQLPDYLESLQAGSKDVPMILLPLLNDLRASRNASLLSESVLFFPDVETESGSGDDVESGKLLPLAKKLRPHYLMGLLGWFKGEKVRSSLSRILAVLAEFEKNTSDRSTQRLWTISAALIEGLLNEGIDGNVSIKMILGHVDRSIKQLLDQGEEVFATNVPSDLLKNLLYYVARINKDSARVADVKKLYKLAELLPDDAALEEARSGLGGLNTELLNTVSQGIREDMLEVKDVLEIFVHADSRDTSKLESLPELMSKIADTLAMLGLGGTREEVLTQKEKIIKIVDGSLEASEEEVMNVAGVLLSVESQLNNFIAKRSIADNSEGESNRVGDLGDMPEAEYLEVLSAVIREALQDFSEAKQAILSFIENTSDKDLLKIVLKRLAEVKGAMFMLPIKRLEPQLDAISNYVGKVLLGGSQVPDQQQQDDLADVVTSVEYYLEAIMEGRPDLELTFNSGENSAKKLEDISSGFDELSAEVKTEAAPVKENKEVIKEEVDESVPEVKQEQSVASAEPEMVESDREEYVILGDDADEEILEIFIEEALEELASLNEQVPHWINNLSDEEALMTLRRSFHTLKGSGRLIGAQLIGEFSWGFENMLNRVIDKSRPANQDVFDILEEALGVLPQLIEQLKGNRDPVPNVYALIDKADALGKWCKPEVETEVEIEKEEVSEKIPDSVMLESEPVVEELSLEDLSAENPEDSIELEDLSTEEVAEELIDFDIDSPDMELDDEITESEDDFDIDLTEDLEALQMAISPEDSDSESVLIEDDELVLSESEENIEDAVEEQEIIPESFVENESRLQIHIDPVLFEIFKGETENHLNQIHDLLSKHKSGEEALIAGPDLIRALHTLYGSARTAEVEEIAVLCGGMEKTARLQQDFEIIEFSEEGVKLLDDLCQVISSMLVNLADPTKRLRPDTDLLNRINSFNQSLNEQVAGQQQDINENSVAATSNETSLVSYGEVDEELVDIFLEEAEELLDGCENSLQRWNANNEDTESVSDLQRQLHTLKGGARMADLAPIGDLTHVLESLIIAVSEGRVAFSRDMSKLLHESMDVLADMLSKVKGREPVSSATDLINYLEALRRGEDVKKKVDEIDAASVSSEESLSLEEDADIDELISFDTEEELNTDSDEAFALEISEEALDTKEELEPELVFEEEPEDEIKIDEIDLETEDNLQDEAEIEIESKKDTEIEIIDEVSESFTKNEDTPKPQVAVEEKASDDEKSSITIPKKVAEEESKDTAPKSMAHEQVRVRSDLLNDLVNHAGEVSVYHARMGQQVTNFAFNLAEMDQTVIRLREQLRKLSIETEAQILSRYEKETDQYDADFDPLEMDRFSTMQQISRSLQETVSDMESIKGILSDEVRDSETLLLQESRVSTELQEGLMRTRMVHFGGLASRLRRIVRQTARELDKDVDLEIIGETTEVDRTVLDRIIAPLEHMLRNAVSHGIELPEDRISVDKPEVGTITISVDREGGDVMIKVVDDGRGIDIGAVRNQAMERGILDSDSKLSDHDILQYIMEPGFSTAEKVTQISGRGVGMDVVDSEIKQLGGVLEIDTAQGKGTTFIIRLPLTLAINHALLVNASDDIYAIPLNSIEGVVRLSGPELQQYYDSGDSGYEFAGTSYELKHLGHILMGQQANYSKNMQLFPVLLVHVGDQRVALHVDDLLGRREIVVKPVGPQISSVRGISGATILGDGRVVLIIEMNALVLGDSLFHIEKQEEDADQPVIPQEIKEEHEIVVMVVDDSITIRKVTERMLSRHGIKVVTAKDGVDAVAQLQEQIPDVMLLDIEMPRMDGYEVATHVRNDERLKNLPIIMITSRSGSKHKDKAMEIGVNKYLGKPYQEDDLMANINELIG